MKEDKTEQGEETGSEREPYRVRLPGFVAEEDIGLGDAVTRMTASVGIGSCGGCRRRAAALNRWLVFTGTRVK